MSKSIKSVAIGLATSLVAPVTSFASNVTPSSEDIASESSNLSRAVSSLNKAGVVTGVASNDYLNVRSSTSSSSSIVGKYENGSTVVITGKDGEWYRVDIKGKTGYVYEKYVRVVGNITYKKTTDNLNMRWSNSTSSGVITTIPKGTTIKVVSTSNEWDKVYYSGEIGFCSNKYLTSTTSSSSSSSNSSSSNSSSSSSSSSSTSTITSMNKEGKVIGVASNDTLNVRSSANANSNILTKIANGTKVKVTGQDKATSWYKIVVNGYTGYVSNKYITIVGDWNSSTSSTTTMYTTTNLNIRNGAGASYTLLATIPTGASVTCHSKESNGWMKVTYGGVTGYVNSSYLSSTPISTSTVKKVTTTNVNMRKGPGTNYSIIKTVSSNTVVEVLETSGSWSKVKVGSDTGYMSSTYLADSSSSSNSNLVSSKPLYSKVKVVIDAGHGGTDPGAVGNGYKEKDIVLSISNKVNSKLKSLGFSTVMTRSNDTYIALSKRYSIANSNNGDLFVSIHANSASSTSAKGIETLYKGSKELAQNIQTQLINETGATNRGVKYRSDLAVLNGTKMPSALVEVGFISNASEASQIGNNSYQEKLSVAIVNGLAKYTDSNIKK